jgi:hypothetical protein
MGAIQVSYNVIQQTVSRAPIKTLTGRLLTLHVTLFSALDI